MAAYHPETPTRCLAAILVADVAGYSRLMERDEYGTHMRLRLLQGEVIEPLIAANGGRVVRLAGDGMLVMFGSATAALRCAVEAQRIIAERGRCAKEHERVLFRIGINFADILLDHKEIAGCGVNLAARLEALACPGGICVSRCFKDQVREDLGVAYVDAGLRRVKNILQPVHVFHVVPVPGTGSSGRRGRRLARSAPWSSLAGLVSEILIAAVACLRLVARSLKSTIRSSTANE